jgi:hypothetical protein
MLIAITGILGAISLVISFSINPGPPAGATLAQVIAFGKQSQNLILVGSWLQGTGSLLEVIFILGIMHLAGATKQLVGWITAMAATAIVGVSLVEVSFYLSATQGGVSGDLTTLSVSLALIKAIQHAYVIAPAPALLVGLGIIIVSSRVLPRVFGYLALALGVTLGVLGFVDLFLAGQQIVDTVLGAQEVWFAAAAIMLIFNKGKVADATAVIEPLLQGATSSEQD